MSELGISGFKALQAIEGFQGSMQAPSIAPRKPERQRAALQERSPYLKMESDAASTRWNERAADRRRLEDSGSMMSCALSDSYVLDVERGRQGHTAAKRGCE